MALRAQASFIGSNKASPILLAPAAIGGTGSTTRTPVASNWWRKLGVYRNAWRPWSHSQMGTPASGPKASAGLMPMTAFACRFNKGGNWPISRTQAMSWSPLPVRVGRAAPRCSC